jgi:hypothetical protein
MKYCEICGRPAEEHHIVFRSHAHHMVDVELNKKPLCQFHHEGNEGPHLKREIDINYKLELQKKLFQLFSGEYYKAPEIKEMLGLSESDMFAFIKPLTPYKDKGFERMVIVLRCMGGKIYVK